MAGDDPSDEHVADAVASTEAAPEQSANAQPPAVNLRMAPRKRTLPPPAIDDRFDHEEEDTVPDVFEIITLAELEDVRHS
jgi:hypothetical protein